jgi:hypothetical protein
MLLLRLAPRFSLAAALFDAFYGYVTFDDFPTPSDADIGRVGRRPYSLATSAASIAACCSSNAGIVRRLYVSGVNPEAGIWPENFAAQFSAHNPQIYIKYLGTAVLAGLPAVAARVGMAGVFARRCPGKL